MRDKCLACHTEMARLIQDDRGLHPRVAKQECASCHPEHAGLDFDLVHWDEGAAERFDHRRAGWALEGKHATTECRACHKPAFQHGPAAALMKRARPANSWIGLESACKSCHEDVHRGALDTNCMRCHDTRGWKPAPGFDHAKSDYPLTGKHAAVACEKCHLAATLPLAHDAAGQPLALFKPVPHGECSSCHRDPHATRFGAACAKCHTTESWQRVNEQTFDHERTRYPLRGKHAALACATCHDPVKAWGKDPKFAACTNCHADAHGGLATLAGKPADCAACHAVAGWTPSTYTVEQHRAAAYPLGGKHEQVACASCHPKAAPGAAAAAFGTARVQLRPRHERCASCHADAHGGEFTRRADRGACESCHAVAGWRPSAVDVAAHQKYDFPLEGAHRATPCFACHPVLKPGAAPVKPLALTIPKARCETCHENPHGDQFAARRDHGACAGCHSQDAFAPAARFDHNRDSAFRLEGAHARAACGRCHATTRDPNGRARTSYRPLSAKCESCHITRPSGTLKSFRDTLPPQLPALLAAHRLT